MRWMSRQIREIYRRATSRLSTEGLSRRPGLSIGPSNSPAHKYGKSVFVFCGGGCKAIIQAVMAAELVHAGFHPTHIVSASAGTCNALGFVENPGPIGAEKTLRIWEDYINSPDAIYEIHPFLREKLARLLGVVPQVTQSLGPSDSVLYDVRRAIKFVPLVLSLGLRMPLRMAGRTVSFLFRLMDAFAAPSQSFRKLVQAPEIQTTLDEVNQYFELQQMKALLDPFPLLSRLTEQIDVQKVLASPIIWKIVAERYEDGATVVFSNKDPDLTADGNADGHSLKTKQDLFMKRIRASMALYPLFELVEIDGYRYLDGDLANPLPIEEAFNCGCETIFILLNMPRQSVRVAPSPLRDLLELNAFLRLNERYLHHRLKEAQVKAKELGVNLFVIGPDDIPSGLGLLEIDRKVIEVVKQRERTRMKDYLADLDAHNLRFAAPMR